MENRCNDEAICLICVGFVYIYIYIKKGEQLYLNLKQETCV